MWIEDLRNAFRGLRSARGFALTAILSLTVGIGGSVSMFTVVNSILLKPLSYPDSGRLVCVTNAHTGAYASSRTSCAAVHPLAKASAIAGFDRAYYFWQHHRDSNRNRATGIPGGGCRIRRVLRHLEDSATTRKVVPRIRREARHTQRGDPQRFFLAPQLFRQAGHRRPDHPYQ